MNCIIIGDRYNKGMKSKGCSGLIRINKRYNVFQNQYKVIKKVFPKSKIIYVYGFENKKIASYLKLNYEDVVGVYNDEFNTSGYCHSINCAKQYLNKDCLLFFGDLIIKSEIFNNFDKKNSHVYINKKNNSNLGCIIDNNKIIQNISYDLDNYLMNMYYFNQKDIKILKSIVSDHKHRNCFVFEAINKMVDLGVKFHISITNNKKLFQVVNKHGV